MPSLQIVSLLSLLLLLEEAVTVGGSGRTEHIAPADSEAVWIPSGEFVMGASRNDLSYALRLCNRTTPIECPRRLFLHETPQRRIRMSGYFIGLTETSNAQYEACVRAGACQPRSGHRPDSRFDRSDLPVIDVSHIDASSYCRWRRGRLPTEAEWERAARGPTKRRFPWGNLWNGALANHGRSTLPHHDESDGHRYVAPVTAYPHGGSPFGLLNMAGNVWEWVSDWYDENSYSEGGTADPSGPEYGQTRVIRGGSWATPAHTVRVTARAQAIETDGRVDIGFRCAWDR